MCERVYITCVRNIYVLCVCMYTQYVCMCILYIQYMYSMCAREYNVCVCVVTYILVILRSSAAVVRASFSSLNSSNNLSLHSSASAQHTHPHISHHFTSLTHIHYYIHSHHIKLYIVHIRTYSSYNEVCMYAITLTHSHICTYYLSLYLLAVPSVAPQIPTHKTHTHTHDLVPVRAYGGMELPGIWLPILQVRISQQLPLLTAVQLYLQIFEKREKERVIHDTYTTVCRKKLRWILIDAHLSSVPALSLRR